MTIPVLANPQHGPSLFINHSYTLEDHNGLQITPRIDSQNFRHRRSEPGYFSTWHLAGDPTLIIIRKGSLRIGLRDGTHRDFSPGDQFIAQDHLPEGATFDPKIHGHTAQVIGPQTLEAVHLKLTTPIPISTP